MSGGVDLYLCTDNLNDLKEEVKNAQEFRYPFDCSNVLDQAQRIKMNRIQDAIIF